MPSLIDTFFIILFVITVSVIIGLSIVNVVDKKLSSVSINVPPVKIPETKVIVNICEDSKGKLNVGIKQETENINGQNKIEQFIVADANDFNNYDDHKKKIEEEPNSFDSNKIDVPLEKDKVDYDLDKDDKDFYIGMTYDFKPIKGRQKKEERSKKLYYSSADFGWEPPRKVVSCANSSISQQFKSGDKSLLPYQIDCTRPNKLTAENYWKMQHKIPIIPIEDQKVLGHNYMNYSNWVEPSKSDFRILSQSTKGLPLSEKYKSIPVGFNYGFHNSPAMRMP